MRLPETLSVYRTDDALKEELRSTKFFNYKKFPSGTFARIKKESAFDSEFEIIDEKYRLLSNRYWYTTASSIHSEDLDWLLQFSGDCLAKVPAEDDSFKRLKYINRSLLSDMLAGNDARIIDNSLPLYLSTLRNNDIEEIAFTSLKDLIGLFAIRNEQKLLRSVFNSQDVPDFFLGIPRKILIKQLEAGRKDDDPVIALFFTFIDNDVLKKNISAEDAFLVRYHVAKTFESLLCKLESNAPISEKNIGFFYH